MSKNEILSEMMSDKLDLTQVTRVTIEDVDMMDFPKFTDAFISNAWYRDVKMTEKALDRLNEVYPEFVYRKVWATITT